MPKIMAATKKEAAKMAAGKSNTAAGRAVAGSHLWMQHLVGAGRFPTLARMFAAQLGEEVEWIAPLPQNDFKEYKLNQDEAMAKLFPHADKASLFDFWPSNQPQWDGIAIGRDSGALYLVEAKAHRKEAEGQKLGATAQESIDKIKDTLRKWHDAHFPQGDFSLWTDGHYQLANRLAFLYEMRARCVPHHFPDVRLVLPPSSAIRRWRHIEQNIMAIKRRRSSGRIITATSSKRCSARRRFRTELGFCSSTWSLWRAIRSSKTW